MRKIIHVDMDSFYPSVEQADDIRLKNKPVIIGSKILGVVTTASYEVRAYGVKSAMPAYQAFKLCPHAIFIYPNRKKYQLASDMIYKIFKRYSSKVQMLALDEAYIDVSDSPSATLIGLEI